MQIAHQTRACSIVVALYRGKVVGRQRESVRRVGRTDTGRGRESTRGRGKLRAGESWRKLRARKKF